MRALVFCPSGAFALSAAEGERIVAVWPTPDKGTSSRKKHGGVAAASLAVEQTVVGLATAGERQLWRFVVETCSGMCNVTSHVMHSCSTCC